MVKKVSKKERFPRFRGAVRKFRNFFGRRFIWSGLLAGLLWVFSTPFLLTAVPSFENMPLVILWTLFFPLELSNVLTWWTYELGLVDANGWTFIVIIASVFVGMFVGLACTYSIHRIRLWRRKSNVSRTKPSE